MHSEKDLDHLAGSFRALGWKEPEINVAISVIMKNPKKFTVVMPEHYKKEAELHARNTCKYKLKMKEGDKDFKKAYDHFYHQYLVDAYNNSKGIEDTPNESGQLQNPSTPRAEAAFQASLFGGKNNPYAAIVKKYEKSPANNDKKAAVKFVSTLKAAGMSFTHLYLRYIGDLVSRSPNYPELSIKAPKTSYEFAKEMSNLSIAARDAKVREIGHNNFMRQIILTTILKVVEPVFKIDFPKLVSTTKEKCKDLPSSVYNDRFWLDKFARSLELVIRNDLKDLNIENIVLDTFTNLKMIEEKASSSELKDQKHNLTSEIVSSIFSPDALKAFEIAKAQKDFEAKKAAEKADTRAANRQVERADAVKKATKKAAAKTAPKTPPNTGSLFD
jgi:hypothetical protein